MWSFILLVVLFLYEFTESFILLTITFVICSEQFLLKLYLTLNSCLYPCRRYIYFVREFARDLLRFLRHVRPQIIHNPIQHQQGSQCSHVCHFIRSSVCPSFCSASPGMSVCPFFHLSVRVSVNLLQRRLVPQFKSFLHESWHIYFLVLHAGNKSARAV